MKYPAFVILFLSFLNTSTAQTVPSYVPVGNLEAWYSFLNTAADSSGNGNNGAVYGASCVADRFSNPNAAYSFNGTSYYIIVPPSTSLNITTDISVAAWVKSQYTPGLIYFRGDSRSSYDPYILYIGVSSVSFGRNIGAGYIFNHVDFPISIIDTSLFHLLVGTYSADDDSMKIYFDGQLQQSAYLPGVISYFTDTAHNTIGACDYGTWQFFKGTIDDLGTWSRRLNDCEISKLYLSMSSLITANPADFTGGIGSAATFSISDTGGIATYQWQENAGSGFADLTTTGVYSGVHSKVLNISATSTEMCNNQYRCIRNGASCADTSATGRLLCPTTTVIQDEINLNILPNPNDGNFTINATLISGYDETLSLEIFNLLGQKVFSKKIINLNNTINEQLILNEILVKGTYFLKLYTTTCSKVVILPVN